MLLGHDFEGWWLCWKFLSASARGESSLVGRATTVEPPLTDPPNSGHLAYAATWQPGWSAVNTIIPHADTLIFHKADSLFSPSSSLTVQNSFDNVDAGMPLMQDCPPLPIKSTTGHYSSTGMHSMSFWLAFPARVKQGKALEYTSEVLKCTSMHCQTYQKYTGSLWSRDTSSLRTL